jgi:hypothetical protein
MSPGKTKQKKKKSEGLGGGAPRGAEATPPTTRCCHISKTRNSILTTRALNVITRSGLGSQRLQDVLFLPKILKNASRFSVTEKSNKKGTKSNSPMGGKERDP